MGLFGKSDKEKEQADIARHEEARRKLEEARKHQAQQGPATTPATPAAKAAAAAATPTAGQVTPVSAPGSQGDVETYTVVKGDSLSKIAKSRLGDGNAWRKIYDANREVIGKDPDKIFPGQQLRIPRQKGPQTA